MHLVYHEKESGAVSPLSSDVSSIPRNFPASVWYTLFRVAEINPLSRFVRKYRKVRYQVIRYQCFMSFLLWFLPGSLTRCKIATLLHIGVSVLTEGILISIIVSIRTKRKIVCITFERLRSQESVAWGVVTPRSWRVCHLALVSPPDIRRSMRYSGAVTFYHTSTWIACKVIV